MDQNIDFSGSDQIQTPQYSEIHPPSQEIRDKVFQAKGDLMKSIQTFLEEFNYIPFGEKPKILLQAWDKFFAIKHAQPEDSNELFQKLLEDLQIINKELAEYVNSPSRDRPIFFEDDEDHYVQCKEDLENSSKEIAASNSNQEKEKPPQDFDIRQIIREECCIEVCEEQRQNMENTILELVKICQQKELYCMDDNEVKNVVEQPTERRTHIIESLQNFRVIHKSSISLKNTSQISSVHAVAPILSNKEPEYALSMGYKHLNTTPKTESDEIIKSGVEELVSIPNEYEIVSLEEENVVHQEEEEFDLEEIQDVVLQSDNSLSDNFSPEFKTFCDHTEETRSSITTTHANDSLPEYDSFCFEIEPDQERLTSAVKNDISDDLTNDPLLEEVDLFLASDNLIPPGIENFGYDSEGDIRFLEALLSDDSILFPNNEESDLEDDPSFLRPPPEPPDAEFGFEPDTGEEILVVMNKNDELECLDPSNENDDYFPFMFVIRMFLPYLIYSKVFTLLLSAENEDTIFDPGFTPHRLKFLVFGVLSRSTRALHPFFEISLEKSISLISIV
nr:hypothetical protein [Tanacetum cinerariifolium]